ncbi:MAG TPA: hypothetical protein VHL57_00035 [Flavobacteriales bacterium]|jgi:hypothetical protein|nr:hypothetical protein [Flavobacteriales bacterium]
MTHIWFWIGHVLQLTFKYLLVSLGWIPVVIFSVLLFVGMLYWLNLQAKYNRRAEEKGEYI